MISTPNYLSPIPDDWKAVLALGQSKDSKPGTWKNKEFTLESLKRTLSEHVVGTKDGSSFLQGSCVNGTRTAKAIEELYIIGLDVDNGTPSSEIDALIEERGLWAIRYTTHSHHKAYTKVQKDDFVRFQRANPGSTIQDYLITKKRYLIDIAATAKVIKEELTPNGMELHVGHTPMDKNRIIFILAKSWKVRDYETQQEALDSWRDAYLNFAKWMGVECDRAVTDTARLFYAPRHERDTTFEVKIHEGKVIDIFSLPKVNGETEVSNVFLDVAKEMGAKDGNKNPEQSSALKAWLAAGNGDRFLIHEAMLEHCPDRLRPEKDSGDKHHIECPYEHEHSTFGGSATFVIDSGLSNHGAFVIKCMHNSCTDRDRLSFLTAMVKEGWIPEEALFDPKFLLDVEEEVETQPTQQTKPTQTNPLDRNLSKIKSVPDVIDHIKSLVYAGLTPIEVSVELNSLQQHLTQSTFGSYLKLSDLNRTVSQFTKQRETEQRIAAAKEADAKKTQEAKEREAARLKAQIAKEHNREEEETTSERVVIYIDADFTVAVQKALNALVEKNNKNPRIFRANGGIVRIVYDELGLPRTEMMDIPQMSFELAQVTRFLREYNEGFKEVSPPSDVVSNILSDPNPPFEVLSAIVTAPVFGPDGKINTKPGYDPSSKLFYSPSDGCNIRKVPDVPTNEDVDAALNLINDCIQDFPFDGPFDGASEKAHALCLILQPFARQLINGNTPLYFFTKPSPGTGASKLINLFSLISCGEEAQAQVPPNSDEEMRKRISSVLVSGANLFYLDNIPTTTIVDFASLASASTTGIWTDRLLGSTKTINIPVKLSWVLVGNNPKLSSEIARRCVRARLDSKMERPELRRDFKIKNLEDHVREHRAELIWACLTLIQNWIAKGKPSPDKVKASYEAWSNVMGGILRAAEIDHFLENESELRNDADEEGQILRAYLASWWKQYGDKEIPVSGGTSGIGGSLFELFEDCDAPLPIKGNTPRTQKNSLSAYIGSLDKRLFTLTVDNEPVTVRVDKAGGGGSVRWKLTKQ